jgi:C1A family cysteine protease
MPLRTSIVAPLLALLAAVGLRADDPGLRLAPPNPDFVRWQQRETRAPEEGAGKLGFVPPPVRYPKAAGPATEVEAMVRAGAGAYPGRYDMREMDLLSPIRNQNPFGTCWAFAPYASLESNIKKTTGTGIDFSEWHTAWFAYSPLNDMPAFTKRTVKSGEDAVFDQGGHGSMFTAVAARGTGPTHEEFASYQNTRNYAQSSLPNGLEPSAAILERVYFFDDLGQDAIKGLVQTHGALAVSMLWPESNEGR